MFTECAVARGSKCGASEGFFLKISTTVAACFNVLVIFICKAIDHESNGDPLLGFGAGWGLV
jgi:hypothetical protein